MVEVKLHIGGLRSGLLGKGVKEKTIVNIELFAASPGEGGVLLSLHALGFHVVEEQVLLLVGPPSLLVRRQD